MEKLYINIPFKVCFITAIFILSLTGFSSCEKKPSIRKACGEWESIQDRPGFVLSQIEGVYFVKLERRLRGKTTYETYRVTEEKGFFFIQTGFSIVLTYDKKSDIIYLSPGGVYKRKSN